MSFSDETKMMEFVQMPWKEEDAWRQIAISPSSLYSSLLIDRKRLPKPTMHEGLNCAMDYEFNLKSIRKGLISNINGFYCGYRIRSKSITRSDKRIDQLKNHSRILLRSMLPKEKFTEEQLELLEAIYALGLSKIAKDNTEIVSNLRINLKIREYGTRNTQITTKLSLQGL